MRSSLNAGEVDLDFLDGYLFAQLQMILFEQGEQESGLGAYYSSRVNERIGGLMEYEERLTRFLMANYRGRLIIHPGTGVGTLPCALACNGMRVVGIEATDHRSRLARRIRDCVTKTWPDVESRYHFLNGFFPEVLKETAYANKEGVVVFTNFANDWGNDLHTAVIGSLPSFSEAILDLRLFGKTREKEADRAELFERIAAMAVTAERIPDAMTPLKFVHLARFTF